MSQRSVVNDMHKNHLVVHGDDTTIQYESTLTSMVHTLCVYLSFVTDKRKFDKDRVKGEMFISWTDATGRARVRGRILDSYLAHRDTLDLPDCYDVEVSIQETFKWPPMILRLSQFLWVGMRSGGCLRYDATSV